MLSKLIGERTQSTTLPTFFLSSGLVSIRFVAPYCRYGFYEVVFIYMGHLQFCCATKLKMSLLHSKKDKAVGAIICPRLS